MIAPPKYPRTWHWPTSPGVQNDDKVHRFPQCFIGREVTITEKADGGCTILNQGEAWSRASGAPATEGWFAMVRKWHSWKTFNLPSTDAIYGEDLYGRHAILYSIPENETFRPFHYLENGIFLHPDDMISKVTSLGMKPVHECFRGIFNSEKELTSWLSENIKTKDSLGSDREGFVIRICNSFDFFDFSNNVCKYVRANHVQSDAHWRYNWQPNKLLPPTN